ncbi:helix-turn-helix domain-containing protein [Marinisporobacter balticus]
MKKYRKAKGITGSDLANRLNVSVGHISNIENGKKIYSILNY